jgi:hypothetical protein
MSTYINVTVGQQSLLDKSNQQTQANRQAFLDRQRQVKTGEEGKRQRDANRAQQGIGPDGKPLYGQALAGKRPWEEPAAFRFQGKGLFGYMPAGYNDYGGYDAYTEEAFIGPDVPITYKKFGAVKLGLVNTCNVNQGANISVNYFNSRSQELVSYVRSGGVLWVQNEWQSTTGVSGCGIDAAIINAYLSETFNCSVGFGTGFFYSYNKTTVPAYQNEVDANFLVYEKAGFNAPPFFYTDLVSPIVNGTAMYSHPSAGVIVGFEKIGKGFLVLSADSNATAAFPVGVFEGQQFTFIDALLTLR